MFNMGLSELILLGAIALLVIGPKQLPEVARNLARLINDLKRSTGDLKNSFKGVDSDLKGAVNEVTSAVRDTESWVKDKASKMLEAEKPQPQPKPTFGHVDNPNHISKETSEQKEVEEESHHEGHAFKPKNKKEES